MVDHVRFTDVVLDDIATGLAAHPPERGGALIGAGGIVHHLVEDTDGRYSGTSWDISSELTGAVQQAESAGHGTLIGTVHTHPAGSPDPSGQDLRATARLLDENPHLDQTVVCVVTEGEPRERDLPLGDDHRMSVHVAQRAPGGDCRVTRASASVVPIGRDLTAAGHGTPAAGVRVTWDGSERLAVPLDDHGGDSPLLLQVSREYPTAGPLVATPGDTGELTPVCQQPWDPTQPAGPQLRALLDTALRRRPVGLTDRVEGLAGRLAPKRVLIVGLGSVGSWLAAELVRAGVEHLELVDPDHVEASNLARTIYEARHLDIPKVTAATDLLTRINPAITVRTHRHAIGELEHDLDSLCDAADLIVAATDDPAGQALLNHHAYAAGTPLVACGLYRQAHAGEVVIVVPQLDTGCWMCATGVSGIGDRAAKDYATGRLAGEIALGPAIHLVTEVAAGVAIGLLAGPTAPAAQPLRQLLETRRTMGLISTGPRWDFFPIVFAGLDANQWAPQSVWARVQRDPHCPICGPEQATPEVGFGTALATVISELRDELPQPQDEPSQP